MTNAETFLNIFSGAQNKYGKCYQVHQRDRREAHYRRNWTNTNRTTFEWRDSY